MACTSRASRARLAAMITTPALTLRCVQLPVAIRRTAYRVAYVLLRIYSFLPRRQVNGVKCVLTDGERLLLVRHTYGPDEWDLPGGAVKSGELPLTAARREMREELGITIDTWRELGDIFGHVRRRHDLLHCFQASIDAAQLVIDRGEIEAVDWFTPTQLPPNIGRYVRPILARSHLD